MNYLYKLIKGDPMSVFFCEDLIGWSWTIALWDKF